MHRRYIGVELGNHAYTHCYERLKKVVDGSDQGGVSKALDWHGGGGFKFYELAPSLLKEDATIVGDRCMLMTSTHVAHNCVLEDEVIMANLATLGGHCHVGRGAFLGGMSVFHQNVRIGEMCIISGFSAARMDCLPYVKGEGRPPIPHGINAIGLKRRGIPQDVRDHLKEALKILKSEKYLISKACDVIEQEVPQDEYVKKFVQFIRESKRGITLRKAENTMC